MSVPTLRLVLPLFLVLCLSLPPHRLSILPSASLVASALALSDDVPPGMDPTVSLRDGPANLSVGRRLFSLGEYDAAALHFWRAVLFHSESPSGSYTVEDAFGPFLRCYSIRGRAADGFVFVATESVRRGQAEMARTYVESALEVDPDHEGARELQRVLESGGRVPGGAGGGGKKDGDQDGRKKDGKTPEELYNEGTVYFNEKKYARAAEKFQSSCELSEMRIGVACTNAAYCRTNILDWGTDGSTFVRDMAVIESVTRVEVASYRTVDPTTGEFAWRRSTSAHPHMMLGYPVDSTLKRYVAESYAAMDEMLARVNEEGTGVNDLPPDLPYDHDGDASRADFASEVEAARDDFRIRVGFVASGFNSKAVLFLSHDMFRFFDPTTFEVHVFSLGPPDNPNFIRHAMRGVDWRERVRTAVDQFHDVRHLKDDHVGLARYVRGRNVHVLIEWDGYARQGERAQGLFALRPAPVQVLHQEFLGTSGATYVDYIVTDRVASPERLEGLYTEKFLYMPNHFFSKGHAMQKEVKKPTYDYAPATRPYQLGTGSPQENRCLSPPDVGPGAPTFVFCNFNKFLKNNPETLLSWIRILRSVPGSMLCLLENPTEGVPYLRKFVSANGAGGLDDDDVDGPELNSRIHFLPWEANPFDHQMRAQDFCNVMLDSHPYNGHTTAQDSLYGGVPIVTRSDGDDMSSLVTTSANIVLGLSDLNAEGGASQYEDIAIRLGTDEAYYRSVRTKLIGTCLQKNPMHPYWDVPRYTKNFETGLKAAWERYLSGNPAVHVDIEESDETKKGTHEVDIARLEDARRESKYKKGSSGKRDEL